MRNIKFYTAVKLYSAPGRINKLHNISWRPSLNEFSTEGYHNMLDVGSDGFVNTSTCGPLSISSNAGKLVITLATIRGLLTKFIHSYAC